MFLDHGIPVFSWPYVLPSLLLMLLRRTPDDEDNLGGPTRVEFADMSYPEKQCWQHYV